MNIERLDQVVRVLCEDVPEDQFNIKYWVHENDCGFTGCAIGWCTQDAWFKSEGLQAKRVAGGSVFYPWVPGGIFGTGAITDFFEFGKMDFTHLFYYESYHEPVSPMDVAWRVAEFIKENTSRDERIEATKGEF